MPDDKKETSSTDLEAIHKEAIDRFDDVFEREKDQRNKALEDMRFAHAEDGQWDDDAKIRRDGRPRYTINRVAGAIDQGTGDQRQNRTQIKVRPVTDGSDDVAKIEMGLIRNIEGASDAQSAYDNSFDETITCGYGGWRVLTEFTDDDSFEQEVVIRPIKSAASSLYLDPDAEHYDKRDSMYGFVVKDMAVSTFKSKYPDATVTDFSNKLYTSGTCSTWFMGDMIRIGEYWRVTMVDTTIALLSDGRVIDSEEEKDVLDELAKKGITILKERKTKKRKVESFIMNGAEVIKGPMPWAGKYIPLVPEFGRVFNIEGKEFIRGIVRNAKDANRIFNYTISNNIEATALAPKDPYWMTPTQVAGHEAKLKSFNTSNSPFLFYNEDPLNPGPPKRTGAPAVQQALLQQAAQAVDDIHATTGLFPPAMGNAAQLLSEKSVRAQADKGDRGLFVFTDNLHKSIKFTGDILVDLLPRIYDTERTVRILNFDGTTENVEINAKGIAEYNDTILDEETGEQNIVNDLSRGKYETFVEAGPAFTTLKEESAQQLIDLASASPRFERLATDLIAKNINIIEGDELTQRVRADMIKEGVVKPTEEEIKELGLDQEQQPSESELALLENLKIQTAEAMARIEKINAETDNTDAKTTQVNVDSQSQLVDAYNKLIGAYKLQTEIGIPLGISEHHIKQAQLGLVNLGQEDLVDEGSGQA